MVQNKGAKGRCGASKHQEWRIHMDEKVYKTMGRSGALAIIVGVISIVVGLASGVLLIISGGRLLARKSGILF